MDNKPFRIILIGKAGCGKSSTGNFILQKSIFKSKAGSTSVTKQVESAGTCVDGRNITVVDTPGLFDTNENLYKIALKVQSSLTYVEPGPHAFLIVIHGNARYNEDERKTIETLQLSFGPELFKHAIIAFTHEDDFDNAEDLIHTALGEHHLQTLINKCNRRCITVNNKSKDANYIQTKLMKLIEEVGNISKDGIEHYTEDISEYKLALELCYQKGLKITDPGIDILLSDIEDARKKKANEKQNMAAEQLKEMEKKINEEQKNTKRERKKAEQLKKENEQLHKDTQQKKASELLGFGIGLAAGVGAAVKLATFAAPGIRKGLKQIASAIKENQERRSDLDIDRDQYPPYRATGRFSHNDTWRCWGPNMYKDKF